MKKLTYYAAALLLAGGLLTTTSCVDQIRVGDGFLEKAEGEDVNEDLIFSSKVYTEYLLWQCYEGLYSPFKGCYTLNSGVMEALSDILHSELGWDENGRMFYTGNLTAANANSGWVQSRFAFISQGGIQNMSNQSKRSIWNCVRDCELLIDNISRVPDMTDAEKARYTAEAKIILASKYFDGIRHFGGLPIVDHAFSGEEQLSEGRSTIEATVNYAVGLLDQAIAEPNLPWALPDADLNTWAGRMTKGAAYALKAKTVFDGAFKDTKGGVTVVKVYITGGHSEDGSLAWVAKAVDQDVAGKLPTSGTKDGVKYEYDYTISASVVDMDRNWVGDVTQNMKFVAVAVTQTATEV